MDSLHSPFKNALHHYAALAQSSDSLFIEAERRDIDYFFDRIILDYPYFHEVYTGNKVDLNKGLQNRLALHLADFNNPDLLASSDVKGYIESFLRHQSSIEVKKLPYKLSDNKRLDAYLNLIPRYISNQECRSFWQFYYINAHLEDWGGKNMERIVNDFLATTKNEGYRKIIDSLYSESVTNRRGHLIQTYKSIEGYNLDMHLFQPDSIHHSKKAPVIVFFSGGSWTRGNPEWAFDACAGFAKKGWVAASVEYRLADRHETTPFEAVKDAKSAIRWLRMHAGRYGIDTSRIVASGNSAGGHLVLATAMAKDWNETTDDLNYSATPNLLLVNSGVYDLYAQSATSWIRKGINNKNLPMGISPMHLLTSGLPPMLLIHGTNDQSVDFATAQAFAEAMKNLGNDITFHVLDGAPHHIWFDRRYAGKVTGLRNAFLQKHGYE